MTRWVSAAGMRRVARLGDGWLASAYNITPPGYAAASALLREELAAAGRPAGGFPRALVTMRAWATEDRAGADRVITHRLAPRLRRDPATLRGWVCIGPAGCALSCCPDSPRRGLVACVSSRSAPDGARST
jgi:hypothetical protein